MQVYKFIVIIICVLFPVWSFPLFPGTYSIGLPLLASFLGVGALAANLNKRKVNSFQFLFLLLFLMVVVSSCVFFFDSEVNTKNLVIGLSSWILFFLSICGYSYVFRVIGEDRVISYFSKLGFVIILVGVLEFILKFVVGYSAIFSPISLFLSGETSTRIILTTAEPSWAVQLLVFVTPFLYYSYQNNKSVYGKLAIFGVPIIFLGAFSLTGYMVVIMSALVYIAVNSSLRSILRYFSIIIALLLVSVFVYMYITSQPEYSSLYFVTRVDKIISLFNSNTSFFENILLVDNSLYVRLGYPYIALMMSLDHPLLGVGMNQYGNLLGEYIHILNVPYSQLSDEVTSHLINFNADPRNFFLKVLLDLGIIPFTIFAYILIMLFSSAKKISCKPKRDLCLSLLSINVAMMMQFSTPYFAVYCITISIVINIICKDNCYRRYCRVA